MLDIGRPNEPCWQVDAAASVAAKYPQTKFVFCHLLSPQRGDNAFFCCVIKNGFKLACGKYSAVDYIIR